MKKTLKEYWFYLMYRGIQLNCGICAYTKKDAAKVFDVTMYFINNWGSCSDAHSELGIKNPLLRMAKFEHSGEAGYFVPKELINKPIKYIEAIAIIDEHRKVCRTYDETIKMYPQVKYNQ